MLFNNSENYVKISPDYRWKFFGSISVGKSI